MDHDLLAVIESLKLQGFWRPGAPSFTCDFSASICHTKSIKD